MEYGGLVMYRLKDRGRPRAANPKQHISTNTKLHDQRHTTHDATIIDDTGVLPLRKIDD